MKEEYRLFREWHVSNAGDHTIKYYISNYGNVKMWTEVTGYVQLTIGHGLCVRNIRDRYETSDYEVRICGLGQKPFHLVWDLFGDRKRGVIDTEVWQIHHKDNDHNNNRIDNLLCVTDREHLAIHAKKANDKEYNEKLQAERYNKYYEHSLKYKEYQTEWKVYLNGIRKQLQDIQAEENKVTKERNRILREQKLAIEKAERKANKEKERLAERQRLIDSGEYVIGKTGRLTKRWTAERRAKTITSRITSDKWNNKQCCMNKGSVGITYNDRHMYIQPSEVDKYVSLGATIGFK